MKLDLKNNQSNIYQQLSQLEAQLHDTQDPKRPYGAANKREQIRLQIAASGWHLIQSQNPLPVVPPALCLEILQYVNSSSSDDEVSSSFDKVLLVYKQQAGINEQMTTLFNKLAVKAINEEPSFLETSLQEFKKQPAKQLLQLGEFYRELPTFLKAPPFKSIELLIRSFQEELLTTQQLLLKQPIHLEEATQLLKHLLVIQKIAHDLTRSYELLTEVICNLQNRPDSTREKIFQHIFANLKEYPYFTEVGLELQLAEPKIEKLLKKIEGIFEQPIPAHAELQTFSLSTSDTIERAECALLNTDHFLTALVTAWSAQGKGEQEYLLSLLQKGAREIWSNWPEQLTSWALKNKNSPVLLETLLKMLLQVPPTCKKSEQAYEFVKNFAQ